MNFSAMLGMAKTIQTLFVIFAGPQRPVALRTFSIAQDCSTTMIRLKAARFCGFADAKEFAQKKHVTFNALTYIGLEDFTDLEIQG
jgi:hypothetical protein